MSYTYDNYKFETIALHAGQENPDPTTDARAVPIYATSSYVFHNSQHAADRFGLRDPGNIYSRLTNPTEDVFEQRIAALEGGIAALAVSSGAAAITYAVQAAAGAGDHIVAAKNIYGGTYNLLAHTLPQYGIQTTFVDPDPASIQAAIQENTKAVIIESLGNPNSSVIDIEAVANVAHENKIPLIIDSTFATPYLIRPIEYGADIVVHSATKYLGGHSDVVAGLAVTNRPEIAERLAFVQNAVGGVLGPFDSFLLIRGIKTLAVRMDRHVANAESLAARLAAHPEVSRVWYPGLKDFPVHDIQFRQAKNGGAMISFELADGKDHREFFRALRLVTLAESLGGVESLVCHPASMTHASIPKETREKVGITDRLIRLSVGIEDVDDIWSDIENAIEKA